MSSPPMKSVVRTNTPEMVTGEDCPDIRQRKIVTSDELQVTSYTKEKKEMGVKNHELCVMRNREIREMKAGQLLVTSCYWLLVTPLDKNRRNNTMSKKLMSMIVGVGMLVGGLLMGISSEVWADSLSDNSAAMVLRIIPKVERGVTISTGLTAAESFIELGSVDMGASTQTVSPATVTVTGNLATTELDLSAKITGGWVFQNEQVLASTGANQLNAWMTFTSISTGGAPAQNEEYFRVGSSSSTKLTSPTNEFSATAVGSAGGTGIGKFENNEGNDGNMDNIVPDSQRHLWSYFRLPPSTSLTAEQYINVTLSVRDAN